ncbi:MAG TPA: hypothetical protein VFS98_12115 [Methylomirabilota bacterium]|nr:hypothetical protein [Methylomirabilota bacterium]
MSRLRSAVLGGLLLAAAPVISGGAALAAPEDALRPVEKYTTVREKSLASAHRTRLLQFAAQIYNCLPWLAVYPGELGFRQARDNQGNDLYLSMWIWVDQREDASFAALSQQRRVSAMFSRYGVDMLRRMAELSDVLDDRNVAGLSVVLSWLKPGTSRPGRQAVNETLALFVDKATAMDFLAKRVAPDEFASRSQFTLFDGLDAVGRVPLEVWEDSFNSTYKVNSYDPPKGAQCQ